MKVKFRKTPAMNSRLQSGDSWYNHYYTIFSSENPTRNWRRCGDIQQKKG